MTEHEPNALARTKPTRRDPWPEPEPLVRRHPSDTPAETRALDVLEACTLRALSAPRQP